jgi:hypothetical protein
MAGGISMGAALGLLGGVPVQPAGAKTIIEKLRAAKSMMPGEMGAILSKVLSGGPEALLKNPIGAIQGQLSGQLSGMVTKLTSMASGGPQALLSALTGAGGYSQVLGQLGQVSNMLSGLATPGAGQFGLINAMSHANVTSMLGEHLPVGLSVTDAMGPVLIEDRLNEIHAVFDRMIDAVVAEVIAPEEAAAVVIDTTAELARVMAISQHAFTTIQDMTLPLAQAAAAISMIASGPAELAPIVNLLIRDEHKAEIQAALDEQIRPAPLD